MKVLVPRPQESGRRYPLYEHGQVKVRGRLMAGVCQPMMPRSRAGVVGARGGCSCALWHRLLGRPVSDNGRLCHGDGGHAGGHRCRRAFMLTILPKTGRGPQPRRPDVPVMTSATGEPVGLAAEARVISSRASRCITARERRRALQVRGNTGADGARPGSFVVLYRTTQSDIAVQDTER